MSTFLKNIEKEFDALPLHSQALTREDLARKETDKNMKESLERGVLNDGTPYFLMKVQLWGYNGFRRMAFIASDEGWSRVNLTHTAPISKSTLTNWKLIFEEQGRSESFPCSGGAVLLNYKFVIANEPGESQ